MTDRAAIITFWPRLAHFSWRWRWLILAISLSTSLAAGLYAWRLQLDANLISLLPEDTDSVRQLRRVLAKTGGFGDLMLMIEGPEPETVRAYARDLLPKVRELPWVEHAAYGQDPAFFRQHGLLYLSLGELKKLLNNIKARIRQETLRQNPFYIELEQEPAPQVVPEDKAPLLGSLREGGPFFETDGGRTLFLVIRPRGVASDLDFSRLADRQLRALIAAQTPAAYHQRLAVTIGGTFINRLNEYRVITSDVRNSALIAGLGILLLLGLYFRRLSALPLLALPLALSLSWTFALAHLVIGSLNIITVFLIVILFGLGIDFGIHLLTRFFEEQQRGADHRQASAVMLAQIGPPLLVTALTTALAFATLMLTHFRGFSEFGFIAATGLVFSALAFLLVLPASLAILSKTRWLQPRVTLKAQPGPAPLRHPCLLLGLVGLLTAIALLFFPGVQFEYDLRRLRAPSPETRELNSKMRQVFPLPRDPAVVWVEDARQAQAVTTAVQSQAGAIVKQAQSIHDLLPRQQQEKLAVMAEIRELAWSKLDLAPAEVQEELRPLLRDLKLSPVRLEDLPEEMKRPFLGLPETAGQLVFIYQSQSVMDLRQALRLSEAIREIPAGGRIYRPTSEPLVFADILRVLRRDVPLALGLTLLAVLLALFMIARRPSAVAAIFLPLVLGVIWMFGLMGVLDLRLNILNIVVLPTVLGLGVDNGVHLYHRARAEGEQGLRRVLRRTGVAAGVCTLTSMIGFSGMMTASHPGLRSIGQLAVIGLGTCLLAALLFLPALLVVSHCALWLFKKGDSHAAPPPTAPTEPNFSRAPLGQVPHR